MTESHSLALAEGLDAVPFVDLDTRYYKVVDEFDERFPEGVPSLRRAEQLVVEGDWTFGKDVTVVGEAKLEGRRRSGRAPATTLGG